MFCAIDSVLTELRRNMGWINGGRDGVSKIDLGSQNKYRRMDSEVGDQCEGELSDKSFKKDDTNKSMKYVMACAFFASLNSVLLGYDVGVMSGAIIFIQKDLKITEVQEETLVGCLSIVSLFGSLAGGRLSDIIGRKWTMAIGSIVFQIGGIIMTIAPSFKILMVGRLISGIGIGLGTTVMGVYIAEISPATSRGFLTSFPETFINLGILLGYVSNYAFSGLPITINWRVMLALGIFPSLVIGFALFIIPESPRWLILQDRVEEAKLILVKTIGDEKEVEERLAEILQAARISSSVKSEEKEVWYELLRPNPVVCKMLVAGVGLHCFQQITGIDALVYYSPTILKAAGIEDDSKLIGATVALGVTKMSFVVISLFLIDRIGRKPLLYISTVGMTICLFCIAVSLAFFGKGVIGISFATLAVCGDVAFFSIGMGPICWVLTSEIYPLRLRAQAVSLGVVGNRLCSGLISLSFLSVTKVITMPGTFLVFSAFSALSVAFVHKMVPETKGKSLEEIGCLFEEKGGVEEGHIALADTQHIVS